MKFKGVMQTANVLSVSFWCVPARLYLWCGVHKSQIVMTNDPSPLLSVLLSSSVKPMHYPFQALKAIRQLKQRKRYWEQLITAKLSFSHTRKLKPFCWTEWLSSPFTFLSEYRTDGLHAKIRHSF